MFAVVDPADPHAVLYLSDRDYKIQVRVSLSTDSPLVVLARAGEVRQEEQSASQQTGSQNMENGPSMTTPSAKSVSSKDVMEDPSKNTPPKGASSDQSSPEENLFSPRSKRSLSRKWHKIFNWAQTTFIKYSAPDAEDALVSINNRNIADLIKRWGTLSQHWSGRGLSPHTAIEDSLNQISAHLLKVLESEGPHGVILLLKTTSVCIRRFLAGNPVEDSWALGHPLKVRKSGIPLWLPLQFRRLIRSRSTEGLRLIFSILNAYKGFKSPYKKMDLSNITSAHPTLDEAELDKFGKWCRVVFWPRVVTPCAIDHGKPDLLKVVSVDGTVKFPDSDPPFLRTAGPNSKTSVLGAALDAQAWNLEPVNWLVEYLQEIGDKRTLDTFNTVLADSSPGFQARTLPGLFVTARAPKGFCQTKLRELRLGKLSLKLEAAGKKRIFAIVDYWTQRALKPLHTWMADILSVLPSDATFDQNGAVRRLAHSEPSACHSYDLKAATDTIPQVLYESLFKAILPEAVVDKWMNLLTDRWYYTPESELEDHPDLPKMIRYTRGQPMGALSSWPSMALVHHAVILYSAWKTGRPVAKALWWDYRVLGDDAVIGDQEVGLTYTIQTDSFHIVIGRKVSLISAPALQRALVAANPVCSAISEWVFTPARVAAFKAYRRAARIAALGPMFEFANQYWLGKVDLSPASLKQELGIRTGSQRVAYALRILLRWESGSQGSWVARLCRYLLPPALYGESVGHWKQGRLGPILQIALAIAFGPFSTLTRRVGLQWSSLEPLLLVLTNSSKILMGRGSSLLSLGHKGGIDDLIFSLCVAYFRVLLRGIEGVRIKMSQLIEEDDPMDGKLWDYIVYGSHRPSMDEIDEPVPKGSRPLFKEGEYPTGIHWLLKEHLLNEDALRIHQEVVSNPEEYGDSESHPIHFGETNLERDWDEIVELQVRLNRLIVLYTKGLALRAEYTTVSSLVTHEETEMPVVPSGLNDFSLPTLGTDEVHWALVALEAAPTPVLVSPYSGKGDPWAYHLSKQEGVMDTELPPTDSIEQWDITPEDISSLTADTAASDLYEIFEAVAKAPVLEDCYIEPSKLLTSESKPRRGSYMDTIQAYNRLVSATAPTLEYLDFKSGINPTQFIVTPDIADMWQGCNNTTHTKTKLARVKSGSTFKS